MVFVGKKIVKQYIRFKSGKWVINICTNDISNVLIAKLIYILTC